MLVGFEESVQPSTSDLSGNQTLAVTDALVLELTLDKALVDMLFWKVAHHDAALDPAYAVLLPNSPFSSMTRFMSVYVLPLTAATIHSMPSNLTVEPLVLVPAILSLPYSPSAMN